MNFAWLRMVSLLLFAASTSYSSSAAAHGSMEVPLSRIYNCYFENPERPTSEACKAAVAVGGTQALYDWNGINRLDANGQHRTIIPDGKLCSAGKETFKGMDLARTDWPAKLIAPDANGNFEFVYRATAPHATRLTEFYVTKNGHDPARPLSWSHLEPAPFATFTTVPLVDGRYHMTAKLPTGKTGSHVIYAIWQRADSTEAFYSCSDVKFASGTVVAWKDLGVVRAQADLPVGSKVTLRVFNAYGQDYASYTAVLTAADTAASAWPYSLASVVNAATSFIHLGVLGPDSRIVPVKSATGNTVYVASALKFSFTVDIEQPTGGGDKAQFDYPTGIGSYQPGTIVRGTNLALYQCRPYPNSGWCNQAPAYYAPGTGLAWADAWVALP